MPEFQAMGKNGVIDRVLAPDKEIATGLFKKTITPGRFPYLYGLWKENDFTVKESKNPRMAGTIQGSAKESQVPSFTS